MDTTAGRQPGTLSDAHRIEKWGPFSVIGAGVDCVSGDTSGIFKLWSETFGTLTPPENYRGVVGVCYDTAPDTWRYMAAYLVDHTARAPEGTEKKTFPATKFAIWDFKGTPPQMSEAFGEIFKTRLPAAGLESLPNSVCVELYPPEPMDESTGQLRAALHVPVK